MVSKMVLTRPPKNEASCSRGPRPHIGSLSVARSRGASARSRARARFFAGRIGVVSGSYGGFYRECLCPPKVKPIKAADSRHRAPPYRKFCKASAARRNGQAGPFSVAVSRLVAPGGTVDNCAPSNWPGLYAYNSNLKSGILCGGRPASNPKCQSKNHVDIPPTFPFGFSCILFGL